MKYELIKYNENLPFKIFISDGENKGYHLHKEIELVFVLRGQVIYELKDKKYKLFEKDLFLVNSFDLHSVAVAKSETILLILQLNPLYFNQYCPNFSDYYFEDISTLSNSNSFLYNKISSSIANITLSLAKLNNGYKLSAVSSAIEIVLILIQNCKHDTFPQDNNTLYKQHRISEIMKYIEENYSSHLSLETLAKKLLISPGYISRFFKENLGIGFVDYLNTLRITKSLNDLLESNKTILDISIEHGFNDHRAYNRVFKKMFGVTASEYKVSSSNHVKDEINKLKDDYFTNTSKDYFKYLFDFLPKDKRDFSKISNMSKKINLNIDLTKYTGRRLLKYWKNIISIESASLCLIGEVQSQIKIAQKELKYEFIRFHGIFSDELKIYNEDSKGNPLYNWYFLDLIFDFLYEVNLKPFIVIDFMPEALASKRQYTPYSFNINVSYPKSLKKWSNLVSMLIKHCIDRYGETEVQKWCFQIWNAPELPNIFWYESKERFFNFYKETYFSIKQISPKLKVGSAGALPIDKFKWFHDFLKYCLNNSIVLDFACCNIFTKNDPQNKALPAKLLGIDNSDLSLSDIDYLKESITLFRDILNSEGLNNLDILVTEWNLSPYNIDFNRDTCFLSSYIIHNILHNIDNIHSLAFLSLSDITNQGPTGSNLFHGGCGLFTRNSIKKPSFNAFYILNKLESNIIEQGKDYIITAGESSYQILLYNFVYFDELFRTGDKSLLTYQERYSIFQSAPTKEFNIVLNIEKGKYKVERYTLNRDHGSSFDAWIKMGAPEDIDSNVYNYLKTKEIPNLNISTETVNGQLILNDIVPVHGIVLIEINKTD